MQPEAPVKVRLIAFNDFHGHLETPPDGVTDNRASLRPGRSRVAAGGVAHLATAIRELRAGHAYTAVVAAGDLVSASPLASSLFLDEPSVNALSDAGLELSSVGNHEFDRGRPELERLQRGGCSGPESCFDGAFRGARYRYLAANVIDTTTGKAFMPAYAIRTYGGVRIAFVGAVLRGTLQIVQASGILGLDFRDEADSVNALVPELKAQGVEAIVLLIHEGGRSSGTFDDPACPDFKGAIVDIMKRLDRAVDVVVSGHTHEAYICRVDGRLVTSAGSYGRFVTIIDMTLDRKAGRAIDARATNLIVEPGRFPADPRIKAYVQRVVALADTRASRVVGRLDADFTRVTNAAGESDLGRLVADSQLQATRQAGAQIAFMNPGGLRASLASGRPDRGITYGNLYAVSPYGNTLTTMTLTGEQLVRLLEQQWRSTPGDRDRILHVSEGFRYTWDGSKPVGQRVLPGSVTLDGQPLARNAPYRVTVNSFLAGGGDGFTVLTEGTEVTPGPLDLEAFESYVRDRQLARSSPLPRIKRVD